VLLPAAPVWAECAWVVWSSALEPGTGGELWTLHEAFSQETGGETACRKAAAGATDSAKDDPRTQRFHIRYICLPDTVDPRGPQG
jgi:hypothetical protein